MRFCGPFEPKRTILRPVLTQKAVSDRLDDLAGTENRAQPNGLPSERIGSTFLAIDDADCRPDGQAGVELRQDVGPRLEAILVQVVGRALAGAQQEVPLEIRVLAQSELQVVVRQVPRVLRMTSRASGSSRSAPGEPFVSESIEPSSK